MKIYIKKNINIVANAVSSYMSPIYNKTDNKIQAIDTRILRGWFPSGLLVGLYVLLLMSRTSAIMTRNCFFGELILAGIAHVYLYRNLKANYIYAKFFKYIIFIFFALLLNLIFINNISLKMFLFAVWIMPALALLIVFCRPSIITLHFIFLFSVGLIGFLWRQTGDLNTILSNSRNYIVFFLFLFSLPYYYYCYLERKTPSTIYLVICFCFSIAAVGRGGIIMSLMLIMGWLLEFMNNSKHKILIVSFLSVCILCVTINMVGSQYTDLYFSRFVEKGFESSIRLEGWKEYISSLSNVQNFLFGAKLNSLPFVHNRMGDSLHNSFLTIHARMGVLGFFSCIIIIIKSVLLIFRKKNWFILFYFIAVLVKAMVDADFPATGVGGDINIYVMYLFAISQSTYIRKKFI